MQLIDYVDILQELSCTYLRVLDYQLYSLSVSSVSSSSLAISLAISLLLRLFRDLLLHTILPIMQVGDAVSGSCIT